MALNGTDVGLYAARPVVYSRLLMSSLIEPDHAVNQSAEIPLSCV